jgi:hypothetical protein
MTAVLDRFRLDGRVAIVTGASRGLGAAMARALAGALRWHFPATSPVTTFVIQSPRLHEN